MKRIAIIALAAILCISSLSGCAKAAYIDSKTFTSVLKENGFYIYDVKEYWYSEAVMVKEGYAAVSPDGWIIDYLILSSEDYARTVFNESTDSKNFGGTGTTTKSRSSNSASFIRTGETFYCIVVQAANMVICCDAPIQYKDDVDQIFLKIGVFN